MKRLSLDEREDMARQERRSRRRRADAYAKWNEVRPWFLRCPSCEHEGTVETTLKRLRAANLKCSACGAYLWKCA